MLNPGIKGDVNESKINLLILTITAKQKHYSMKKYKGKSLTKCNNSYDKIKYNMDILAIFERFSNFSPIYRQKMKM